jgi:hypothetical protein
MRKRFINLSIIYIALLETLEKLIDDGANIKLLNENVADLKYISALLVEFGVEDKKLLMLLDSYTFIREVKDE